MNLSIHLWARMMRMRRCLILQHLAEVTSVKVTRERESGEESCSFAASSTWHDGFETKPNTQVTVKYWTELQVMMPIKIS